MGLVSSTLRTTDSISVRYPQGSCGILRERQLVEDVFKECLLALDNIGSVAGSALPNIQNQNATIEAIQSFINKVREKASFLAQTVSSDEAGIIVKRARAIFEHDIISHVAYLVSKANFYFGANQHEEFGRLLKEYDLPNILANLLGVRAVILEEYSIERFKGAEKCILVSAPISSHNISVDGTGIASRDDDIEGTLSIEGASNEIFMDPNAFVLVIENLVRNASRSIDRLSSHAGSQITINFGETSDGQCSIITFKDNGAGIDFGKLREDWQAPELSDFQLRRRLFGEGVSGSGSTGLGLATCKSIISAHGGYITINNNKNELGSHVKIIIPKVGPEVALIKRRRILIGSVLGAQRASQT